MYKFFIRMQHWNFCKIEYNNWRGCTEKLLNKKMCVILNLVNER